LDATNAKFALYFSNRWLTPATLPSSAGLKPIASVEVLNEPQREFVPSGVPEPMKTKSSFVIAAWLGLFGSIAAGADAPAKASAPAPSAGAKHNAPNPSHPSAAGAQVPVRNERPATAKPASREKLPPELAASKAIEEANKEHIEPTKDRFTMETPPPPLRPEKKPPIPAAGMVWVPGHWAPNKGEWQWREGRWGIPATPISVWIDAKYDPKTKLWSPGYWQPDRVAPEQPEAPRTSEDQPAPAKFF
jgi:hypothetical protein